MTQVASLPRHERVFWAGAKAAAVCQGIFGDRSRGRVGMLTYHRVAPITPGLPAPAHNVTPQRFREQLSGLLARGFTPTSLRKVLDHVHRGQALPAKTLVVTFDDGYAATLLHALLVLEELSVPATVFLPTAYTDSDQPFPFDEWGTEHAGRAPVDSYRPLTRRECHKLTLGGLVELGAHTHTHQDFRGRREEFWADLVQNVEILQSEYGVDEPTFAYPFGCPYKGHAGEELVEAAKVSGVSCGLTTEAGLVDPTDDPFRWGRFNAFGWDTPRTLAAKLGGWYSWMPRTRRAFQPSLKRERRVFADASGSDGVPR